MNIRKIGIPAFIYDYSTVVIELGKDIILFCDIVCSYCGAEALDIFQRAIHERLIGIGQLPDILVGQFPQFAGGTISVNSPDLMPGIPTGGALEESVPAEPEPAQEEVQITFKRSVPKVGRNDECPCGSGKKYKKCCGRE